MHRGHGPRYRIGLQDPRAATAKPGLHPLLLEHLEPHTRAQTRDQKTDRVRPEFHEGDNITGHGLRCYLGGAAGTTAARR